MKMLLPFAIAGLLATGSAHAVGMDVCQVESDYDLAVAADALVFRRDAVAPLRVEMRRGTLLVDGQAQPLGEADQLRVAKFERDLRTLVPEVKAIARDAVGIATDAVVETAGSFSGNANPQAVQKIRSVGASVATRVDNSTDTADWRGDEFDALTRQLVAEVAPLIAGDVAEAALAAALSGDVDEVEAIEQRATALETEIQARIEFGRGV